MIQRKLPNLLRNFGYLLAYIVMGGEIMTLCNCKCSCTLLSGIASLIIGIIAAFLQITGTITVTAAFLWVVFGIGVGSLGILLLSGTAHRSCGQCSCTCGALNAALIGSLGSILFSLALLAVGIVATSILSAILVGLALLFLTLLLTNAACVIRSLFNCCD